MDKFCDELFEMAGTLYWPLDAALHTDINYLLVSYEAHVKHINRIFGGEPTPTGPAKGGDGKIIKFSPAVFDAQFPDSPPNAMEIRRKR